MDLRHPQNCVTFVNSAVFTVPILTVAENTLKLLYCYSLKGMYDIHVVIVTLSLYADL